jgi:pyruvate dehydrogenase E2 component (dihydrolipoamide acetyltransferase)
MATEVLVPPLGQTVDTVTLITWYKAEGETVAQGDPLFSIETDKATLDIEAPASGVLQEVTAQPGDEVKVLTPVALIAAPDEAVAGPEPLPSPGRIAPEPSVADRETGKRPRGDGRGRIFISPRARRLAEEHSIPLEALEASGPEGAVVERDVRAFLDTRPGPLITPVARRIAEENDLDLQGLAGSGPGGRVTRDDVLRALATARQFPGSVSTPAEVNKAIETIPLRSVRAVIADRMLRSATDAAQVTLTAEADATALVELRDQLAHDGVDVSYNDLFLYILGRALTEHPLLNASLEGDAVKVWGRIHIGLAVDTERGLLVPVVRDVDRKGLHRLSEETLSLVDRARAGQCTPDELSGGTFTVTNLGMYGIDAFTPLINLPECAVLGVGRIKRQPMMVDAEVVGRDMVWLSLTFDHRLVDGGPAARFLQRVVQLVERPHLLIT